MLYAYSKKIVQNTLAFHNFMLYDNFFFPIFSKHDKCHKNRFWPLMYGSVVRPPYNQYNILIGCELRRYTSYLLKIIYVTYNHVSVIF